MERDKIKDALSKSDVKTLFKLVKHYNTDNGLAPIYENDEESIKELRDCGYIVDDCKVQDFAFLTPDRYGGVSGCNDLSEVVNIESELVPYVEANYTTYAKDLHIDDAPTVFDVEWLKENWKGVIGHERRYLNLIKIADKVNEENSELADKLYAIAKQYDSDPKRYTYNYAKEKYFKLFKENVPGEAKELSEEKKMAMRQEIISAYNQAYKKEIKEFKEVPVSWREALVPLIEGGREEAFKKKLKELKGDNEKAKGTVEDLKKDFKKIYGFDLTEDNLKNWGFKEDIDGSELLDCFKETIKAFKEGKIDYARTVRFFEKVYAYPNKFEMLSEEWYQKPMSESETKKKNVEALNREVSGDLDTETGSEALDKIKAYIKGKEKILEASDKDVWKEKWKEYYKVNTELYQEGSATLEEYLKNLKSAIDFCLIKAGLMNKKVEERKEKAKAKEDADEKYIFEEIGDLPNAKSALIEFERRDKDSYALLIPKLANALKKKYLSINDLGTLSEEDILKFFALIVSKDKKAEEMKNLLQSVQKESE